VTPRAGATAPARTSGPVVIIHLLEEEHVDSQGWPVILGFLMIVVFMTLIMTKRLTPPLALILVPTVFGLFTGAGLGLGDMVMDGISSMASTAALLMFAIIYFGLMIDVGLFDKLVLGIMKISGHNPVRVVVGTALLAMLVSLDGDGSTTFIIVTAAMLPVYQRMKLSPVVLTCVAGLANGTTNIVPWGGPTARAAAALKINASDIFVPMVPSLAVGIVVVLVFSWHLGVMERKRLQREGVIEWNADGAVIDAAREAAHSERVRASKLKVGTRTLTRTEQPAPTSESALTDTALDANRPTLRPKLLWFNLALTVAIIVLLVLDKIPLPYLFMVGSAIALVVNFPRVKDQAHMIASHASSVIAVVSMVMAAAVLTGVLEGTGMVKAMSGWLVDVIPGEWGPWMAVLTGIISIPATFLVSNDAFYFGILPVLSGTAQHYGLEPVDMARASIVGQPVHLQSPLVPAILLLVSLAGVNLGDHHKKVLWRALVVSLVMLAVGMMVGSIPIGHA
jgi:CitMHS family citrate-Mg2+:H+ or citrate-Ca2+:H+ symporter